ncbi:MAG: ATP-binding protein [Leptospiraceae bacterium]|nr:ATP-binding protein [Leptospiraceae bacterium]MCP5502974.1 ATP-binding protein [Leptospiraceae bacterium]
MKKLPLGVQTFSKMIHDDLYYVDKTQFIKQLVDNGTYYFLSRPRRFGKSSFLDTLKEAFEGNEKLFKGLYLEKNWDWTKKHPVIMISFGGGIMQTPLNVENKIKELLHFNQQKLGVTCNLPEPGSCLKELIIHSTEKYNERVIILIDEYDKPILDNIVKKETALEIREILKGFYSVIKDSDRYIKFAFITGVSKFSKVNLFSGLNNLTDISLDRRYATICGYTESELPLFEDRLEGVDREKLKLWYNGYNFLGDKVYNPFDILLFFDKGEFKNYWFETGSPSFLIKLIQENQYNPIQIEHVELSEQELGAFDVEQIRLETILFQTGYLTIKEKFTVGAKTFYSLTYPNLEVKMSFTEVILNYLSDGNKTNKNLIELHKILTIPDLPGLKDLFYSFFASIPHNWYRKNTMANYEGYYASIFYCYFTALGLDVRAEEPNNNGQVDMTVFIEKKVYVFEFKVIELTEKGSALEQIKKKKYYEKHLSPENREIYLVGVEFSKEQKNITNYEWEQLLATGA